MLNPLDSWKKKLEELKPTNTVLEGAQNFAKAIASETNLVQAGGSGTPGILKFTDPVMAVNMVPMTPTGGDDWVQKMVLAWQQAMLVSIVTPGIVTSPLWTASGVDILTLPLAPATIPSLATAAEKLRKGLQDVADSFKGDVSADVAKEGPKKIADAFRQATLAFQFNCIGLVIGAPPTPLPIIFKAQ